MKQLDRNFKKEMEINDFILGEFGRKGYTLTDIASLLGLSHTTLVKKLSNAGSTFKMSELMELNKHIPLFKKIFEIL